MYKWSRSLIQLSKNDLRSSRLPQAELLTLADFSNVWLEDEMDPPAFTKGKEKEKAERMAVEQGDGDEERDSQRAKKNGKKKAKEKKKKQAEKKGSYR